jgi:hypothetical protein
MPFWQNVTFVNDKLELPAFTTRLFWDEVITRLEESYRLWCIVACDLETK